MDHQAANRYLAGLSALARHFSRFCRELDPGATPEAWLAAALATEHNLNRGDTCLALDHLAGQPLLDDEHHPVAELPPLEPWCEALRQAGFVGQPGENAPLILDGPRLYLARHWQEEQRIATRLLQLNQSTPVPHPEQLARRLEALFPVNDPAEALGPLGQKRAAAMALTRQLAIITGGPGTGKTTTVTRLLALLLEQQPDLRIRLAAPTGKAATRLLESISEQCEQLQGQVDATVLQTLARSEASTLHRLLGWRQDGYTHHAGNPLPCDCLLVDEVSMVDQGMMARLLDALPEKARLILLGDRHQLASVEAGSVLGELTGRGEPLAISPERAKTLATLGVNDESVAIREDLPPLFDALTELQYSYRFAQGGGIGRMAQAVKAGETTAIRQLLQEGDPAIHWLEAGAPQPPASLIHQAAEHYRRIFEAEQPEQALERLNQARILSARAEGPWGEGEIRQRLETHFRQQGWIASEAGALYPGLPILIRQNDRETGLFNGDTGILWPDPQQDNRLQAWFPAPGGGLSRFSIHQLPQWQPAWTLTVHRSQGSEYDHVLLVLPPGESRVLSRELIYTGITRARKTCLICAETQAFLTACRKQHQRHSGLYERLCMYPESQ